MISQSLRPCLRMAQLMKTTELDPLSDDSDDEEEDSTENQCQPFPGDGPPVDSLYEMGDPRFVVGRQDRGLFCIYDRVQGFETYIHEARLHWDFFSIGKWFAERCAENSELEEPWVLNYPLYSVHQKHFLATQRRAG